MSFSGHGKYQARDRRYARISMELLANILYLPGDITHIEMNHSTGAINIFFEGDGSQDVCTEGLEAPLHNICKPEPKE